MTSELYKSRREFLGYTQAELAAFLGVNRVTVAKREGGGMVTSEAWLALNALPKKPHKRKLSYEITRVVS